jgi:NAD(P)-dependent dehydrogenase (short-subunit alcohol dehydrogenase family)
MKDYQPPPQHLADRVILVTGAGQGIGRCAALAFAAHGATVILAGRQLSKLEAVYDEIEAQGLPEAVIFPLDLEAATEQDYADMAEGIYRQLGRLDGILHNAAHYDNLSPLEIQTLAQFEQMLRVNLLAPFALTKACLPLMQRSPDASVVYTSTSAAQAPAAYWGAHAVSKQAAAHMMQIWAQELEKLPNLRFNSVIPGAVQSPQRKKSHPGEVHERLPAVESLMPAYLYLMGSESSGVSGNILTINQQE